MDFRLNAIVAAIDNETARLDREQQLRFGAGANGGGGGAAVVDRAEEEEPGFHPPVDTDNNNNSHHHYNVDEDEDDDEDSEDSDYGVDDEDDDIIDDEEYSSNDEDDDDDEEEDENDDDGVHNNHGGYGDHGGDFLDFLDDYYMRSDHDEDEDGRLDDDDIRPTATVDDPELLKFMPTCPITLEPIRQPVVAADGHTYERDAILQWFNESNNDDRHHDYRCCSPMTNQPLSHLRLVPNYVVVKMVEEMKATKQTPPPQRRRQRHRLIPHFLAKNARGKLEVRLNMDVAEFAAIWTLLLILAVGHKVGPFRFAKNVWVFATGVPLEEAWMEVVVDVLTILSFTVYWYFVFHIQICQDWKWVQFDYSLTRGFLGLLPFFAEASVIYYSHYML